MKHLKRFNENFITDLFKKSDEDKIADEILKKLETSEVKWVTNFSGLGDYIELAHYLSEIVFENNTIQLTAYKDFSIKGRRDIYEIYIDDDLLECSESKSKKIYKVMEKRYSSTNKEQNSNTNKEEQNSNTNKEQITNRIKSKIKFDGVPKMKNPPPPKIKRRNIFPG